MRELASVVIAQGQVQRGAIGLAELQCLLEFVRHELRKHDFAKVMQQTSNKTIHRFGTIDPERQLLGNACGGQRMDQILLPIKTRCIAGRQHANGGNAQGQILDGVEAQVHHRVVDGRDLLGQAVISRIDDTQHLDSNHRVFVNDLHQVLGGAVDIACQLQDSLHTFGKGRHAIHRSGQLFGKFRAHGDDCQSRRRGGSKSVRY